ncbi:family 43 glycosylhydrolase [bacterium]|nr:family 43 glycosylhydrolase [bacterium]
MFRYRIMTGFWLWFFVIVRAQNPSFQTYVNPVIPGDHPDPTLTKIGAYFYTSGSSFNPTPKIFRSTDLVHWDVIAQPVSASWSQYGNSPGGGIWGGHMVLYNGLYWHYFGRGGGYMYFVTADQPEGPWSAPTRVNIPSGLTGLGVDNSIFIDEGSGKWYMLTKAGKQNNHILEMGEDGQPTGTVLDLTWLNPDSEGNPYGWAEGPVMWKRNGFYYYSFAQHLSGAQYVMRSETLTDDEAAWTIVGNNMFTGNRGNFGTPNHISPVVMLDDGTSWTIAHSNHSSSWHAQGRQGLLCQVYYDDQDFPYIQFPTANAVQAPVLPGSGIPWMVPKSDMFNSGELKPEWSFLGYKPDGTWSLTDREGWLHLEPYRGENTILQNDGEHSYSLITRLDFAPESVTDEAGLRIINGPETHEAKVFSTVDSEGRSVLTFSFESTAASVENPVGSVVWLKLVRNEHMISGYFSADGIAWNPIGGSIDARTLDTEKPNYNDFTGNQQGPYVKGKEAWFDLYVYKDAYTPINADSPANQSGTSRKYNSGVKGYVLDDIHADDWAMFAGVEFGDADYDKVPDTFRIVAAGLSADARVEVWLDSLDTGQKITECPVGLTDDSKTFQTFTSDVEPVTGQHDVYLRFSGLGTDKLFLVRMMCFMAEGDTVTAVPEPSGSVLPRHFGLEQNFPNPFNPLTHIGFQLPEKSYVSLRVTDVLGKEIGELAGKEFSAGDHSVTFDASSLPCGVYTYTLKTGDMIQTRKMMLLK